jgi:hypothetical protein
MTPSEPERSPAARILAERALVGLLTALDDENLDLIVLGGLVPEVLVSGQDPPAPGHLGTTDVDLLLTTRLTTDQDLGGIEAALQAIGFAPAEKFWRWRGEVMGQTVKIEFLCDLPDREAEEDIELLGCDRLVAWNLRGTGFVAEDWHWHVLSSPDAEEGDTKVRVRFAGLCGYLLSKVSACRNRGLPKDHYDLVYVLLHNRSGGPTEAAAAILASPLAAAVGDLRPTLVEVRSRFMTAVDTGPTFYADECLRLDPDGDERELRADAVAAAREFFGALNVPVA